MKVENMKQHNCHKLNKCSTFCCHNQIISQIRHVFYKTQKLYKKMNELSQYSLYELLYNI